MYEKRLCCAVFFTLLMLLCLTTVKTQNVPCSKIFQYITFGGESFGLMTLHGMPLKTIVVEIEFMQREPIMTNSTGNILLNQNHLTACANLESGKPISYRIDFPNPLIAPTLITVNVNGDTICNGTGLISPSNTFKLQHTFNPVASTTPSVPSLGPNIDIVTTSTTTPRNDLVSNVTPRITMSPAQSVDVVCGRDGPTNLVVGSINFKRGKFPWLVAIFIREPTKLKFTCNGSLISSRTVITSAKCFKTSIFDKAISVYLGRHNLGKSEEGYVHRDVFSVSVHFDFEPSTHADILLLHMSEPVEFNEYVRPICLWTSSSEPSLIENGIGLMAGWVVDADDVIPSVPKLLETNITPESECNSIIFAIRTTSRPFCSFSLSAFEPCIHSGSGLMVNVSGIWVLGAILATNDSCDHGELVFSYDVAKYIPWIRQNMLS